MSASLITHTVYIMMEHICHSYLLFTASSVESGSSVLLVSGRRKLRAPPTIVMLPKMVMGITQWYMARMFSSGATNAPDLPNKAPKAVAVCLEEQGQYYNNNSFTFN